MGENPYKGEVISRWYVAKRDEVSEFSQDIMSARESEGACSLLTNGGVLE